MVKLSDEEKLTLIHELLVKGVGPTELQKLGININKLSISMQCKLANKLLRDSFSKEDLDTLGFDMQRFPINEQITLNTIDARKKNKHSIDEALGKELEK